MLSLARLESGVDAFQHMPLALEPAVRRCVEEQRGRAEAKGLDYGLDLDLHGEVPVVTADEEAIRQILDNLIDNAIKYTPERGRVRVTLRAVKDGIVLEVSDTGIGIPRDDLPRVFERFYRVDKARSREVGGTGLGLSIVRHLVQSIGGQITVDSRLAVGSTFMVRLPRSSIPRPAAVHAEDRVRESSA
jgi:two-component system phosphate regulon sensor histidine kinase PhoR